MIIAVNILYKHFLQLLFYFFPLRKI